MNRTALYNRRRAFSLIEILVVISIIALLIAILLPSLSAAREQAKVAQCLSNLRTQIQCTQMYMEGDSQKVIPWYRYPALPGFNVTLFTPMVFGGFQAPIGTNDGWQRDAEVYPAQARPLNAMVDPMARDRRIIDLYKCPSDRSYTPVMLKNPPILPEIYNLPCWQAEGTSYPLNTHFMSGYSWPTSSFQLADIEKFSRRIVPHLTGGKASRFVLWLEQRFSYLAHGAAPTLATTQTWPQSLGWHRQFSRHSAGFYDGHAEYRYFDTRLSSGDGWTLWEPK